MNAQALPVVLVLACGHSRRFRASLHEAGVFESEDNGWGNKLHAQLGGQRVMDWTVAAARASGLAVRVHEGQRFDGMGESIAAAVARQPLAPAWLILPADLPLIQPASIAAVAQALQQHAVVVPMVGLQAGHPVGFDASCGQALMALTGEAGAVAVVRRFGAHRLSIEDPGLTRDVDTWADLVALRRQIGPEAS